MPVNPNPQAMVQRLKGTIKKLTHEISLHFPNMVKELQDQNWTYLRLENQEMAIGVDNDPHKSICVCLKKILRD